MGPYIWAQYMGPIYGPLYMGPIYGHRVHRHTFWIEWVKNGFRTGLERTVRAHPKCCCFYIEDLCSMGPIYGPHIWALYMGPYI